MTEPTGRQSHAELGSLDSLAMARFHFFVASAEQQLGSQVVSFELRPRASDLRDSHKLGVFGGLVDRDEGRWLGQPYGALFPIACAPQHCEQ
jgi:hypothetical protein